MQGCKGLSCLERLTAPELVQVSKVARCSIVIKFLKKCLGCNDISNQFLCEQIKCIRSLLVCSSYVFGPM